MPLVKQHAVSVNVADVIELSSSAAIAWTMIIKAFGLFWRRDEINWNPGAGRKKNIANQFRLLGRSGKNKPGLRIADFRTQKGIYILYGDLGAHYVGLTHRQTHGKRIGDHLTGEHGDAWDRFSWFGFRDVLKATDKNGFHTLKKMAAMAMTNPASVIEDIEALLIKAMALRNVANPNFHKADKSFFIYSNRFNRGWI